MERRVEKIAAAGRISSDIGSFHRRGFTDGQGQAFERQLQRELQKRRRPLAKDGTEDAAAPYVLELSSEADIPTYYSYGFTPRTRALPYEK